MCRRRADASTTEHRRTSSPTHRARPGATTCRSFPCQIQCPPRELRRTRCWYLPRHCCLPPAVATRSEEHTSELQSLMRISYAVFCLKTKNRGIDLFKPNTTKTNPLFNILLYQHILSTRSTEQTTSI